MYKAAKEIQDQLVAWRREFHMNPELGFHETRTSGRVAEELSALGYRVRTGVGRTGVVGERGEGDPIIALRADMDALPIQEANQVPYASKVPGVMHACGHDAHTAMLLGVATLLADTTFPGTLRLLFQPAEEVEDEEGVSGAFRMAEDGVMEGVSAVLALHVDDDSPAGDIILAEGPFTAGVDNFFITVTGKGGHAAKPHEAVDPIHLSGHAILALHGIVSRRVNPFTPAVLTIGTIHGGQTENVIPEQVKLSGTIRYTSPDMQQQFYREMEQALSVVRMFGGDYQLDFAAICPPVINDGKVIRLLEVVTNDLMGDGHIRPLEPGMGAEDFSAFTSAAPGAMFGLGSQIKDEIRPVHNPHFDIDEDCLPIGAAILAESALRLLAG